MSPKRFKGKLNFLPTGDRSESLCEFESYKRRKVDAITAESSPGRGFWKLEKSGYSTQINAQKDVVNTTKMEATALSTCKGIEADILV